LQAEQRTYRQQSGLAAFHKRVNVSMLVQASIVAQAL
jgi:hypothetical protein